MGIHHTTYMAAVLEIPGQQAVDEIVLRGPDSSTLVLDRSKVTVEEAKALWSQEHNAPASYIDLFRGDSALPDDAELTSGDINVRYTISGGGSCHVDPKFECETHFPQFCALGLCCNHCWIGSCSKWEHQMLGHEFCCWDKVFCLNNDCGFHKLWQCECLCLSAKCGDRCCGVHKPKCDTTTHFPQFCRCGLCCNHCWWDTWCCGYFNHMLELNCCEDHCLCCSHNCGLTTLGLCELFCLQCRCFHCHKTSPHHFSGSSGGWTTGGCSGGGTTVTTTTRTTV